MSAPIAVAQNAQEIFDATRIQLIDKSASKLERQIRAELEKYQVGSGYSQGEEEDQAARTEVVGQEAFDYGIELGKYVRGNEINGILNRYSTTISQIYDFNKFIVDGNILLPTVGYAERLFEQMSETKVRSVRASYTLEKAARLVAQPPTWRDYLFRQHALPPEVHPLLYPRDETEKMVFDYEFERGYRAGVTHVNLIFDSDWKRLQNDVEGHYRFRILAAQNIVSLPSASRGAYPIQRSQDRKTIYLNDVILEVNRDSEFTDTSDWEPGFRRELSGGKDVDQ